MKKTAFFSSKNIAFLAVLLALVIVLQLVGTLIGNLGVTAPSLVLIPIVLGGMLLGAGAGALLGFVFGLVVVICGVTGFDGFTFLLFSQAPVWTILLCLIKGTAAGFASGLVYKVLSKKNEYVAVIVASLVAPVVNTGIFVAGAFLLKNAMYSVMGELGFGGQTLVYFVFIVLCANFIFEFIINAVASPAIYTVVRVVGKMMRSRAGAVRKVEAEQASQDKSCEQSVKARKAEEK